MRSRNTASTIRMVQKSEIVIFVFLFYVLASGFCLLTPAFGQTTYTDSAAASDLTVVQTCNAISSQGALAPQAMLTGGAASGSYTVSIANSSTQNFELYSASGNPNATSWPAGNWVVHLNVTAGSSSLTWKDTCIIRVNSSGAAQATVGSLTGQNISLGSAGVQSMTISGSTQTASATDRIVVVVNIASSNSHGGAKSVTLEAGGANDTVSSPLTPPAPARNRAIVIAGLGTRAPDIPSKEPGAGNLDPDTFFRRIYGNR